MPLTVAKSLMIQRIGSAGKSRTEFSLSYIVHDSYFTAYQHILQMITQITVQKLTAALN